MARFEDLPLGKRLEAVRAERDRRSVESDRTAVAEGGLREFVRLSFPHVEPGTKYIHGWHVDAVCEHLTAVSMGEIRKLAIHQPPGTMKSLLVSINWPVWEWIERPNQRFFSISYLPDLALDHTRRSRDLMQTAWFQARWGDRFKLPDVCPAGEYENDRFGWRYSASIGGGITGWHTDKMVIDDPINPKELSAAALTAADVWWHRVRPTRYRDVKTSATVLVMQRLHELDPGQIAKDEGFQVLSLPMRYEPKAAWARDPRKEPGELLCPDRFPEVEVQDLEKTLGAQNTAAQLQQRPTPEGGLVFKSGWFRVWVAKGNAPPPELVPGEKTWAALPTKFDRIIQSWDCTFKDLQTSDWVVGQVWGLKGPDFFLLDQYRAQANVLDTCEAILAMTRKWPRAMGILVEDKANGAAVMDIIRKRVRGLIPIDPEGGKYARANAVAVFFQGGNVYHPDPAVVDWVDQHRGELTIFPMGAHDDTVDATSQALTWLHNNRSDLAAAMEALEKMGGAQDLFDY